MKQTVIDIYNNYGVSDESIRRLLNVEHPSSYLPFVEKYITKELYQQNTTAVSRWLNQIYAEVISFDDMTVIAEADFYRHALIISDFQFQYTQPQYQHPASIIRVDDTTELKQKLMQYIKPSIGLLYILTKGWPNNNNLKLTIDDAPIIKEHYTDLLSVLLSDATSYKATDLAYFCGSHGLMMTLLNVYKNNPLELGELQKTSLQVLGHPHINKSDYPAVYNIGQELYGDKFAHIYKTGESLDLLGSAAFWEANLHQLTSHELPDMTFTNNLATM